MEVVSFKEIRQRRTRWNAPGRSRVTNEKYGSLIVPHGSNLEAVMCAADVWQCDWLEILDSRVEMCDQTLPVTKTPVVIY